MKKKIVILLGLILVAGLLCPIHFADRQNKAGTGKTVRGLSLPWFNSFEDTPILLKSVDSVIWSYSDSITGTEIIKYEDSGTELKKHTRTEIVSLFNKFTIWTKEEKVGYDHGVLYDWEEYEDRFAAIPRKDRVVPQRDFDVSVSESVFLQNTGKQNVSLTVKTTDDNNKILLTNKSNNEKIALHTKGNHEFVADLNIDTDIAMDDNSSMISITYSISNESNENENTEEFSIIVATQDTYNSVYAGTYLSQYYESDSYITASNKERAEMFISILDELKAKGVVFEYSVEGTWVEFYLMDSKIPRTFDFGEYGINSYETNANEAVK